MQGRTCFELLQFALAGSLVVAHHSRCLHESNFTQHGEGQSPRPDHRDLRSARGPTGDEAERDRGSVAVWPHPGGDRPAHRQRTRLGLLCENQNPTTCYATAPLDPSSNLAMQICGSVQGRTSVHWNEVTNKNRSRFDQQTKIRSSRNRPRNISMFKIEHCFTKPLAVH